MGDTNDTQKVIDKLVNQTIEMTNQWEKKEANQRRTICTCSKY